MHTSSSIFASAISCSLPLPPAIFCDSEIWFLTALYDPLETVSMSCVVFVTYLSAKVFEGVALNSVDAEYRARLNSRKATGHCERHCQFIFSCHTIFAVQCLFQVSLQTSRRVYVQKNCLLPPCSSITSIKPGFSCSIEGTWLAKTPISPDSAGMLTCTL